MVSFSSCVSTRAVGLRLFQNEIYLKYKARCFLNNCCHLADTRYRSFNVFRTRVGKLFRSHNTIFPKVHVKTWLRQNNSRIPLHFKGFSAIVFWGFFCTGKGRPHVGDPDNFPRVETFDFFQARCYEFQFYYLQKLQQMHR